MLVVRVELHLHMELCDVRHQLARIDGFAGFVDFRSESDAEREPVPGRFRRETELLQSEHKTVADPSSVSVIQVVDSSEQLPGTVAKIIPFRLTTVVEIESSSDENLMLIQPYALLVMVAVPSLLSRTVETVGTTGLNRAEVRPAHRVAV